ncbi:MAG: hypothetical protein ACRC7N_05940 [Clostridium sp.]
MKFFQTIDSIEEDFYDDKDEEVVCLECKNIIDSTNCYVDTVNKIAYCSYECYKKRMMNEYF